MADPTYTPGTAARTMPGVVVTMPTPVVVNGMPKQPTKRAKSESLGTARQGPTHLRSTPEPPPPGTGSGSGTGIATAVWRVADLPDPANFNGGWYWLGARSGADGSAGLPDSCLSWNAGAGSAAGAPAWYSRYPFKPSVVSAQHWLYGGGTVQHPRAVNFNTHFIEHMWCDLSTARAGPFTWVFAAMVPTYPSWHYEHFLLDAGRNPFEVGLPGGYSAADCDTPRALNDATGYRTLLTATQTKVRAATTTTRGVQAEHHPTVVPRMYFGVYNGADSIVGNFTPTAKYVHRGQLPGGVAHRHTIIGRRQGRLAQSSASHLLVFEIRYYARALDLATLATVYDNLASTYKFGRYR